MDTKRDRQLRLIRSIINAYHTARLADVPAEVHIIGKGSVLRAFEALEEHGGQEICQA